MPENKIPIVVATTGGGNDDDFTATFGEVELVELDLGGVENFDNWIDLCLSHRETLMRFREDHGHIGYEAAEYIEEQLKRAMP